MPKSKKRKSSTYRRPYKHHTLKRGQRRPIRGVHYTKRGRYAKKSSKRLSSYKYLSKYRSRPSPPYPANQECHKRRIGNDGNMYVSKPNKLGICQWKKI